MASLMVANLNLGDDIDTVDPIQNPEEDTENTITIPVNVVENIADNRDLDDSQDDTDDSSLPDLVDRNTWDEADDTSIVGEQDDDDDTLPDLIYRGGIDDDDEDEDNLSMPDLCQRNEERLITSTCGFEAKRVEFSTCPGRIST